MKSYIIRLKHNAISEKYADLGVGQARKFGIDVEYFDGVNGLEYQQHVAQLGIEPRYKFKKGRAGVFGCFLSHYYLWQQCAAGHQPFLILEHDGYFVRPLPEHILDTFTDVLKLDGLDPYSKHYDTTIADQLNQPVVVNKYHNPQAKTVNHGSDFVDKIGTGNYIRGAYSYIIKPHAAQRLIDWIKQNGFVPADQQIGDAVVDIRVTVPTIARLHPDYHNRIKEMSLTGNPDLL
jgi:GR25 family glycosyltransferase involved in LPS biosynthesis